MRMMLNRRDNGEDGKTENTQGRPDSSYSLQELLIFPQPMVVLGNPKHGNEKGLGIPCRTCACVESM